MVKYPITVEEFEALRQEGKTVIYAETTSRDIPPEGEGWEFWSESKNDTESKALWRKIIPLSETLGI